mmetsp:Transcript_51923/g.121097  ORF Transcript_51923/g.121097 Transcript_51923/m.121097 type:complete len:211 (-) Transcript_51923:82-714(-)
MTVPSLPPDAQRDPSGDTVVVYTTPVWPTKFVRSLQLLRFHTFTNLSQPADTIKGILADGEKPTELTQSVCMSSIIVYLHSAKVFHSLMVLSRLPDTICRLSPEKATLFTSLVWPLKVRTVAPVFKSHRRMVLSHEPDRAYWPSEDSTQLATHSPCPCRDLRAYPGASPSGVSSQIIKVLSRDEDTTRLLCSKVHAIPVTQLRWPSRVPT